MDFKKTSLVLILLLISNSQAQNIKQNLGGSYYERGGNTDYKYYEINYTLEAKDSIKIGAVELNDTEFLFAVYKNLSEWNKDPYENEAGGILKIDLWANGKLSPFLFAETYYDSTQGLDNRSNMGLGFKYRLISNIFSISYALMYENEKYAGWTEDSFSRHSIRPKLKLNLENGFFIDSQLYFKPTLENSENYLLNWKNKLSISTGKEWLTLSLRYDYKFNSNPGISSSYLDDDGQEVQVFYKKEDTTISIGINIEL